MEEPIPSEVLIINFSSRCNIHTHLERNDHSKKHLSRVLSFFLNPAIIASFLWESVYTNCGGVSRLT